MKEGSHQHFGIFCSCTLPVPPPNGMKCFLYHIWLHFLDMYSINKLKINLLFLLFFLKKVPKIYVQKGNWKQKDKHVCGQPSSAKDWRLVDPCICLGCNYLQIEFRSIIVHPAGIVHPAKLCILISELMHEIEDVWKKRHYPRFQPLRNGSCPYSYRDYPYWNRKQDLSVVQLCVHCYFIISKEQSMNHI